MAFGGVTVLPRFAQTHSEVSALRPLAAHSSEVANYDIVPLMTDPRHPIPPTTIQQLLLITTEAWRPALIKCLAPPTHLPLLPFLLAVVY